jgi:hypothetical protein
MNPHNPDDTPRIYNRAFLLSPAKRNTVMELWEIQRYGLDSYSEPDYVCIYGMPPTAWYRSGIRLLARTTVECTRDAFGALIGTDVERVLRGAPNTAQVVVIDPLAGSCNSLYWILRHVRGAKGIAFEVDDAIFDMTKQNIATLDQPIELLHGDYRAHLHAYRFPVDQLLVIFVAPPWGDALNELTGLDLRRTPPPVSEVVDYVDGLYSNNPILYVTQVHQQVEAASLADLERRFDWSERRIYDINVEGMKQGVLLGTIRWKP